MTAPKCANTWLSDYAPFVTFQAGEDGILEKVLEMIAWLNQRCVEFGRWDSKHLSNTRNLIANHHYSAVLIEGDKKRHQTLRKNFLENPKVIPLCAFVGFDGYNCFARILKKAEIPKDFDLLPVGVDGNEYCAWQAVREYRTKVVVIELNSTVSLVVCLVQPRGMSLSLGCGLAALLDPAREKGYKLAAVESTQWCRGKLCEVTERRR